MLRQRVLTAIVILLGLYAVSVWSPLPVFILVVTVLMFPALLEWTHLMGLTRPRDRALYLCASYLALIALCLTLFPGLEWRSANYSILAVVSLSALAFWSLMFLLICSYPRHESQWQSSWSIGLMGLFCLLPLWAALVGLKAMDASGRLVLMLVVLVSVVDIGAYFTGRAFGKRKLAPRLSPAKSWAGFWGGVVACGAVAAIALVTIQLQFTLSFQDQALLFVAALLLAVLSVIGDLFESMLKRNRGVKDSGRTLPGHGGILDRVDSLLAAAPLYMLVMIVLSARVDWL